MPEQVILTIGRNVRERRLASGLTQQQLATKAECSVAYVQIVEAGFSPRRSDVIPRIETALGNATTEAAEVALAH